MTMELRAGPLEALCSLSGYYIFFSNHTSRHFIRLWLRFAVSSGEEFGFFTPWVQANRTNNTTHDSNFFTRVWHDENTPIAKNVPSILTNTTPTRIHFNYTCSRLFEFAMIDTLYLLPSLPPVRPSLPCPISINMAVIIRRHPQSSPAYHSGVGHPRNLSLSKRRLYYLRLRGRRNAKPIKDKRITSFPISLPRLALSTRQLIMLIQPTNPSEFIKPC